MRSKCWLFWERVCRVWKAGLGSQSLQNLLCSAELFFNRNTHVFLNNVQQTVSWSAPHSILQTPLAGHRLGAFWGVKACLANHVWRHSPAIFSRHHLLDTVYIHMEYSFGEHGFKHRSQWDFFCAHRVPGRELSEFLSAFYLCAKANSLSFSQNSPSLPQSPVRLSEFSSPKQYSQNSIQAQEKSTNPNFWVWIFSSGLPLEGVGPKSSVCPSKAGKSNYLGGICRDFAGMSRLCPKSLRKSSCSILIP